MWMIGYRPVERWMWQGRDIKGGIRKLGKSVCMMTWRCLFYILNGRHSGMCGGTSYGQTSTPSVKCQQLSIERGCIKKQSILMFFRHYYFVLAQTT